MYKSPNFSKINTNFFLDQYFDGGLCKSCHSTCETCDGPTEHACLSCSSPLMLHGSRCVAECEKGTFHDRRLHSCQPCLHTCASCLSKTNCTECVTGLQVSFKINLHSRKLFLSCDLVKSSALKLVYLDIWTHK